MQYTSFGTQRCHAVQVGTTEVDLSDVFANKHEEVSAPLFIRVCFSSTHAFLHMSLKASADSYASPCYQCTLIFMLHRFRICYTSHQGTQICYGCGQDGRQKGEVQLAFTFHPFGQSPHGFQHGPNPSDGAASEASPQVSPQVSPHKPGHKAEGQGTGLRAEGAPEPAPPSPSLDESLGPLGQSFMNLAMSHISPSKANSSSRALDEHAYLQLGTRHEGISESPSAPTGQTHSAAPGQPSSSGVPTASPQQRNFYPEEASDDESDMPSQHSRRTSAAGASGSALPPEFKCQQPSNSSIVSAADETVDQASYSSQEVYHAYRTRDCNGRETNGLLPLPQYGAYMVDASPSGHGNEPQPQVPAWRLLGTSPLREGQMQHLEQPQVQQALPGQQYQPPRQSYSQPAPGQGIPQQAYGQGHQLLPQRPEWHLMGGPTSHSGPVVGDIAHGSTSQSFTVQGRGPSYASLAVGSWTDGVNQSRPFARPAVSQVRSA